MHPRNTSDTGRSTLRPKSRQCHSKACLGNENRLRPVLEFVRITMEQMFQYALAAITNPLNTSHVPEFCPQIARVMLTYPLTWRKVDQELFRDLVESISRQLFVHEDRTKSQFTVELICSEPMAVAAFVLWENFFHFDTHNLRMAASTLGNTDGNDELRMLVVDMGGGVDRHRLHRHQVGGS